MIVQRSLRILLIASLLVSCLLPGAAFGETADDSAYTQGERTASANPEAEAGGTKATILQEQQTLQNRQEQESDASDPTGYSDAAIRQMNWDQLSAEDAIALAHALDRHTLQIASTFYANLQQLLSTEEIAETYGWTDEEVMEQIGRVPDEQLAALEQHTAIARLYQQWKADKEAAIPPNDPSASTEGTVPADTLYRITETPYQYKLANADEPVDALYHAAQVNEADLALQGKHGLDLVLQRRYSSMDSMVTSPEYTGHGENRAYAAEDPVWHYNVPSYKKVNTGNVACSYAATRAEYACDHTGKAKYFLVLDDGTTLETDFSGSTVLRYPYSNVKLANFNDKTNKDYPALSVDIDGTHYDFQTESVSLPKDKGEGLNQVVTKQNIYGDKIIYRIPLTYDGNIEITDSVGRLAVLESGRDHTFAALKVYASPSKDKLLKHTQYVWGYDANGAYVLQEVVEHDVSGSGSDTSVAKYTYYDPAVHGKAEFNLYPYWSFSAPTQQIALDYLNQESSQYVDYDADPQHRGTMQYLLLKQVEYPVEGASINYSYSTYDSTKPMLQRGVVRLYQDDNALTYTSYPPVTSVSIRYKKTPDPNQPGTEQWYTATTNYPLTTTEIWKNPKSEISRLANAAGRDGSLIRTTQTSVQRPSVEKIYKMNANRQFLPQSVRSYVGTGSDSDTITGKLETTAENKTYRYVPVSYESYLYETNGLKPVAVYQFLGRPATLTQDQDVYEFLQAPDQAKLSAVSGRLANYANATLYTYNAYGDVITQTEPKGTKTTRSYQAPSSYNVRLLTSVKTESPANSWHYHLEKFTYTSDKLLATESSENVLADEKAASSTALTRTYAYKNKMLSSVTETSNGAEQKTVKQSFPAYDQYGLNPTSIVINTETSPEKSENLEIAYQYDSLGRKLAQTYPDGSKVAYAYDGLGRETEERYTSQDETRTVRFRYTDGERRVTKILPDGTQEATIYTPYGDVEYQEQRAADDSGTRMLVYNVYGTDGQQLSASYPYALADHQIACRYNEDGSLKETSDPVGTTVYARANAMQDGQSFLPVPTLKTIAPNGKETLAIGNRYGEVENDKSWTTDGAQTRTATNERDAFGQLLRKTVQDQTGEKRTWDYRYSPDGQLLYLHDPENNVYQYGYDALGNLVTVTENGTLTAQNHYNGLSWKLSEKDVPSGKTETYTYDATGKVVLYKDKAGTTHESAYTPFHELASYTTRNSAGTIVNKETKTYVPHTALLASEANSNGPDTAYTSPNRREVTYRYDAFQRMNEFTAYGRTYQIRYTDADDLLDELVYPDDSKIAYTYDAADRLASVRSSLTGTVSYDYTVGEAGQTDAVAYPNGYVQEQHRDAFGQIDSLEHQKNGTTDWTQTNQYSFGSVTTVEENGNTFYYGYDKIDRLTEEASPDGTKMYSYDARGNRKTLTGNVPAMTEATFSYDSRNRLQTFADKIGHAASYQYYGDGLLATKKEQGKETNYVYLNGKVIEELDENGSLKARNIWGNQLILRKDYTSQQAGYYLYNSHGDVVSVVDENGKALNTYAYDTWGNIVSKTEGMSNPFTYSGEMYDEQAGLYYLRARYYDPGVGRFVSEDTYKGQVDNPLSLNRYTYVHNNPLNNVDPTGHWCESKDGKYAHAGSCNNKSNNSSFEADYKHDNDFIKEDGVITGVYQHVEGAREDVALEVNTFLLFAPLPKFLWGGRAAAAGKTAVTVWDSIKVTQAAVAGTNIPKSFVLNGLKASGHELWVHPNATKHMVDYMLKNPEVINLSMKSKQMIEQAMLTSFRTAVEKTIPTLKSGRNFMNIGQWEIGINVTEKEAVIYHALFK